MTACAAAVLAGAVILFVWLQLSVPPLERVSSPERALALIVGRSLDLEEAFARAPVWERWLYEVTTSDSLDELEQAIAWYEELAAASPEPLVSLQLGILEGEAGHLDRVRETIAGWERNGEPFASYARLLKAAYLAKPLDRDEALLAQAELAELLPAGWFYDKLAGGVASRAGDRSWPARGAEIQADRTGPLVLRSRILVSVQLVAFLIGVVSLVAVLRRRHDGTALKVGPVPLPPQWSGRTGMIVLIRGGAAGAVITVGLLLLGPDHPALQLVSIPLTNLPVLLLAQRHLFGPLDVGLARGLGLWPVTGGAGRFWLLVAATVAAGLLGEWGLGLAAEQFRLSSHWTEWFDGDLVWGPAPVVLTGLVEYVLLAPLFEEVLFRGLLFATLRRRLGAWPAAAASATLFAAAHGYGLLGFASVFWSGLLWAWIYEKSGSLWPSLTAHALNNLLVCVTTILLLRE